MMLLTVSPTEKEGNLECRRPSVLMVVTEVPVPFGTGAAVRTFHFVKALVKEFRVYLAITCPDPEIQIPKDIQSECHSVIVGEKSKHQIGKRLPKKESRYRAWIKLISVLLRPSRNWCTDLYRLAFSFGIDLHGKNKDKGAQPVKLRHKLIKQAIDFELKTVERLGFPLPIMTLKHWNAFQGIKQAIDTVRPGRGFDIIWYEHSFIYPLIDDFASDHYPTFIVCNTHNIEYSLKLRQMKYLSSEKERRWLKQQAHVTKKIETLAFSRSNLVYLCSEQDRRLAEQMTRKPLYRVAGNGVDTNLFQRRTYSRSDSPYILYTGAMSYAPNADAVNYFLKEIFPLILQKKPNCKFAVAGRKAREFFTKIQYVAKQVFCIDSPTDMRDYFEQAWVCVVPLRSGSGTRLKILEALAMECAVVSTSIGAEGVPYEDGKHLLIRDTPKDFAQVVVRLLDEPDIRRQLEKNGRQFVNEFYDWSVLTREALEQLCEVTNTTAITASAS